MRLLLFLLSFTLVLFACSPTANTEVVDQQNSAVANRALTQQNKSTKRDSIVPRSTTMRDRSRRKEAINANFPFDIPLEDISQEVKSSDQLIPKNGKPTVVLFWLTTCYPCRLEMKAIAGKYEQWKEEADFNLVAISTDWDKNYDAFVKQVKTNEWPWESYRDINREFRKVLPGELNGLPQSFIFDGKGEIAYHSRKYQTGDEDKLFAKIKSLN